MLILIQYAVSMAAQENKLDVVEMRMLRWMSGVAKLDRIRNERIRGTTKVGEISKKMQESRLTWYGHVLRIEEEYVGKRVMGMEVPGKRRRGRPKRRWLDNTKSDLSERELLGEEAQDWAKWRRLRRHIDPHKSGKGCGRRRRMSAVKPYCHVMLFVIVHHIVCDGASCCNGRKMVKRYNCPCFMCLNKNKNYYW